MEREMKETEETERLALVMNQDTLLIVAMFLYFL
jgi:hypothetical protein